jgi:hypothetical protein
MPVSSQESNVSREGNWRIWYTSSDLRAELDFHWADRHPGDEWLLLKLSVAGGLSGVTSVNRTGVRLQAPDGSIFGLPTQAEFLGVRGSMQVAFQQENIWGPPASRFTGSLERIEDWFFSPSGALPYRETIHPSSFQYCSGPLVFHVPGGVQPGGWMLIIDTAENRAEIPFVLGANGGPGTN